MIMQRKITMANDVDMARLMPSLERTANLRHIKATMLSMASRGNVERITAFEKVTAHWYCLRVMTGNEFSVEKQLAEVDVECLVVRTNSYKVVKRGRVRIVPERPVIVGYVLVFCVATPAAMMGLLSLRGVLGVVGGADRPYRADGVSISHFKALATSGKYDHKEAPLHNFMVKERVRVTDGPFASFDAVIVDLDFDSFRATVEVEIFGRLTPMQLDIAQIEKV
jgi:transcriptional antiterminator NusG